MDQLCREVVERLTQREWRVVFAESCTGGLLAATLAQSPGISDYLCGSAVAYRNRTKQDWLGVPPALLEDPGPVSETVAQYMAEGALRRTLEATVAVAITGHLGPDAPPSLDGQVYVGTAVRGPNGRMATVVTGHQLATEGRVARQVEAARCAFRRLLSVLDAPARPSDS